MTTGHAIVIALLGVYALTSIALLLMVAAHAPAKTIAQILHEVDGR